MYFQISIDYEYGRRSITVLHVSSKILLLGPAERADVVVDFSKYAVPAVPTNKTAVLSTSTSANLTWQDNATNETGFVIERSTDGDATYSAIVTPTARSRTGNMSYTDRNIGPGTNYTYRVKAINGVTSSSYSRTARVTVQSPLPPTPGGYNSFKLSI